MQAEKRTRAEFGDFQTPIDLAREVCSLIAQTGFQPACVLEPTCGAGAFVQAALEAFPNVSRVMGFDLNPHYVEQARAAVKAVSSSVNVEIRQCDFFQTNWADLVAELPQPILILGNPPWVTSAHLGAIGGSNLPAKSNIDDLRGINALTGASNFDISEWMLRKNIEWLRSKCGMLAVLCKASVARKVLVSAWQESVPIVSAALYRIDAKRHFGVAVDACLLLVRTGAAGGTKECSEYGSLRDPRPINVFGLRGGMLVADMSAYERWHNLAAPGLGGWRSGIKHDCNKVFELRLRSGRFLNGLGELVELEDEHVFPMLKSSDLAANRQPRLWMLVPQRAMGENTLRLQRDAPKTWQYLEAHSRLLDRRASSIYKTRPRFSVFGVGPYSFAPWKVAISGLYKQLDFMRVPPFENRPVVLDDTCYFFPCRSQEESELLHDLVRSNPAVEFWSAFIFWDSKRPVTSRLLNLLDLAALARVLGKECSATRILAERQQVEYSHHGHQRLMFPGGVPCHEVDSLSC
jgi:hypothetical protein